MPKSDHCFVFSLYFLRGSDERTPNWGPGGGGFVGGKEESK